MFNKLFKAILSKFLNIRACSCLSSRRHRRMISNIFCIILILISGLALWFSLSLWKLNVHPSDSQVTISVKAAIQELEQSAWWQDVPLQAMKTRQPDSSLGSPHWPPAPFWANVELLFHNQTCCWQRNKSISALDEDYMKYCLECPENSIQTWGPTIHFREIKIKIGKNRILASKNWLPGT